MARSQTNEMTPTDLVFRRVLRPDLVSQYQLDAMEIALARQGVPVQRVARPPLARLFERVAKHSGLVRNLTQRSQPRYLVPILRRSESDLIPVCYTHEIITWSFDCWPAEYALWERFFRRNRIHLAFISARSSAEILQARIPDMRIVWSPEATDPSCYDPLKPLHERSIHVLELGRRNPSFHEAVRPYLACGKRRHLYERIPGEKIFPTRRTLAEGLGDAVISVCFPASITHPEAARGLETATHRYFESIASKCILVGKAPVELIDLFGYNPVVEVPHADQAVGTINELLEDPDSANALVQRNYLRLMEVGTWDVRAKEILEAIADPTRVVLGTNQCQP